MKIQRNAILALAACTLCACTSLPPLDFATTEAPAASHAIDAKLVAVSVARAPDVAAKKVQADELIYPLWKEALSGALSSSKTFSDTAASEVKVAVQVIAVDAPEFGIAMTTKTSAKYDVTDAQTGAVLLSKVIDSTGVVPGDYNFMGIVRMQESINRSVRNNILEFIKMLQASGLPGATVAAAN
jgi:hypothetical protein